jgi:glycosyltransferase involved in cell wall biosynthesis
MDMIVDEYERSAVEHSILKAKFLRLDEKTLGYCRNAGAAIANGDIITQADDDDYYAPPYLRRLVGAFEKMEYDVIGKASAFYYFVQKSVLTLFNYDFADRDVSRPWVVGCELDGPTMSFKKEVIDKVQYQDITYGEDTTFQWACHELGMKIYSTDCYDFVKLRHGDGRGNVYKAPDVKLMNHPRMKFISFTDNFIPHIVSKEAEGYAEHHTVPDFRARYNV